MNKRITSILLCFVLVLTMLGTTVPAFAYTVAKDNHTYFKLVADKTEASPGDTINCTAYLGPVKRMNAMKFKLKFPEGLTYVANSGQAEPGIRDKMGAWSAEFTESTKVWLVLGGNYTTDTETKLMTFQFTVDSGASGDYTVELISDLPTNTIENRDADGNYPVIPHDLIHCTVSINNPATGISVSPSNLSLAAGTVDTSLTAAVTPADSTDSVVWSSSNTAIAQVDSATGKVTAIAPGTAVITAKAGSKSATCNVNVTCTHNLTTIPAKESDCSNNGWHAYQKCTICNELFDTSGIPITDVPYADLNNNHDFDTSKWGYKAADGHATVCKHNSAHHSAVIAHTPDRTAPTEVDPVKCTVCGYTIKNALSHKCNLHLTKTNKVEPTCTADGNIEYYTCECGKIYEDAAATRVIENISDTILEKKGHDYSVKNSDAEHRRSTATDCREYDTYWFTCANDATHNAKNDGSAANKYYNGTQGAHVFGTEFVDCGEAGHAHNCRYHNNAYDAVQAHHPDRTAPTEVDPVKCTVCGHTIENALSHKCNLHLTKTNKVEPTCTADGNIEYYTCECGKIYEDAAATRVIENISDTILEKKGHDYSVKNSDAEHRRSTATDCREYDTYWFTCANDATHNAKNDGSAANKYYNGAQGAHVFGTKFVDCGEAGHAHNCQYHNNVHDAVQAHRPDREAPAENVPVKCLDCARILTPALGHDLVKIEDTKPKKTKIKKVKASKKALTVIWNKVSGVKGYQVQVATDKKFKKNKKTVTIKKRKTTKITRKKLKARKKYYVRVRTYKTVNGKKVYSSWSNVKNTKTK